MSSIPKRNLNLYFYCSVPGQPHVSVEELIFPRYSACDRSTNKTWKWEMEDFRHASFELMEHVIFLDIKRIAIYDFFFQLNELQGLWKSQHNGLHYRILIAVAFFNTVIPYFIFIEMFEIRCSFDDDSHTCHRQWSKFIIILSSKIL